MHPGVHLAPHADTDDSAKFPFDLPRRSIKETFVDEEIFAFSPSFDFQQRRATFLTISGVLTILANVLNLAEQFVVYAQIRGDSTRDFQLRFLIFVTALAGANLIRYLVNNRRIRLVLSIITDTIEFGIYYALLQRTTGFFIATAIFYAIEIVLHIANLIITGETKTRRAWKERTVDVGVQWVLFFFCNVIPFMTLFLTDGSEFRKDYFEYILILNVYLGTTSAEILSEIITKYIVYFHNRAGGEGRPKFYNISEDDVQIVQYYAWLKFVVAIGVNFLTMPILIFVISAVQLAKNDPNLPRYDRNAQIVFVSFIGFYFLLAPLFIPLFILFVYFFINDFREHAAQR